MALKTVEEAVEALISQLPVKKRWEISRMEQRELIALHFSIGMDIRAKLGLHSGNEELLKACARLSDKEVVSPESASMIILTRMWKRLRETHRIKVIK